MRRVPLPGAPPPCPTPLQVDLAQRDFCLAFAELDSLRKLRRRDADRIAASEKKVDEVRRALQSVQRKEEVCALAPRAWAELFSSQGGAPSPLPPPRPKGKHEIYNREIMWGHSGYHRGKF